MMEFYILLEAASFVLIYAIQNQCSQPVSHKQCILLLPISCSQVQTRLQTFVSSLQQKTSEIEILAVSIWQKPELIPNS